MSNLSVIIPSRNLSNLEVSVAAVKKHDPTVWILVIWDRSRGNHFLPPTADYSVREVEFPFVYARNINIGIQASGSDDVVLLNDDAILESPNGFTALQNMQRSHPEYGLIGAALDQCGTPEQIWQPDGGLRTLPVMCVFACVFIPRKTIERVGFLDESFCVGADGEGPRGYGCEDDDYSWRVRKAGLKLGVYDGCRVNHTKLPHTYRSDECWPENVVLHEEVFFRKWGRKAHT